MGDLFPFIETVGFPIVISLILLIRIEKTMRNLTKSVEALTNWLEKGFILKNKD